MTTKTKTRPRAPVRTPSRAPTERTAPAVPQIVDDRLDRILDSLGALSERIEKLEEEKPKFVPMKREIDPDRALANTYVPPEELLKRTLKGLHKAGQSTSASTNMYEDPEYLAKIPPRYRPAFKSGDAVEINPDAVVWGSEGRYWRDVKGACGVVGEVMAVQFISKTYEPKYTVFIPGFTKKGGTGLHESELLPVR